MQRKFGFFFFFFPIIGFWVTKSILRKIIIELIFNQHDNLGQEIS